MVKDLSKVPFESLLFPAGPTEKTRASFEQAKKEEEMKNKRNKPKFKPTNRPDLRIKSTFNKMLAGAFGQDSPEANFFNVVESNPWYKGRKKGLPKKKYNMSHMWTNARPIKKWKVDKFAAQKLALKKWGLVKRAAPRQFNDYLKTHTKLNTVFLPFKTKENALNRFQLFTMQNKPLFHHVGSPTILDTSSMAGFFNNMLQNKEAYLNIKKQPLSLYNKVFYYYTLQTPFNMYAHKAFVLLEMQLNATLVRAKLVPYLFMVRDLCFYRLVQINSVVAKNPHQLVSLYDAVNIPIYLHNYMYYRQYRIQYYPKNIGLFFKNYWAHFTNYTNNKVWLLSNFITSDLAAETIIFDYPNITLYMGPFKRFTKLYYKNHPYAASGKQRYLNHTHTVLKLKLFEYAAFYR